MRLRAARCGRFPWIRNTFSRITLLTDTEVPKSALICDNIPIGFRKQPYHQPYPFPRDVAVHHRRLLSAGNNSNFGYSKCVSDSLISINFLLIFENLFSQLPTGRSLLGDNQFDFNGPVPALLFHSTVLDAERQVLCERSRRRHSFEHFHQSSQMVSENWLAGSSSIGLDLLAGPLLRIGRIGGSMRAHPTPS